MNDKAYRVLLNGITGDLRAAQYMADVHFKRFEETREDFESGYSAAMQHVAVWLRSTLEAAGA